MQVRMQVNSIIGCGDRSFHPWPLVDHMQEFGICTLNRIGNPILTSIWQQYWLSAVEIGLAKNWSEIWTQYTDSLRLAHVHFPEVEDELVWNYLKVGGKYSAKLGYQYLFQGDRGEICWWFKLQTSVAFERSVEGKVVFLAYSSELSINMGQNPVKGEARPML
jgi:hypothetical protein